MYTTVYLACVLAAYSIASPAQFQTRGFGGYSDVHQEQQQQSSAESSSTYQTGGGYGGVGGPGVGGVDGGFGGYSQFSQQSSVSYWTVINSFSGISSQIAQMQSLCASGSMSQQIAIQQMTRLASSFHTALYQAPLCGSCFSQSGFPAAAGGAFRQFTELLSFMQSSFGDQFGQICAPFVGLQSSFQYFFRSVTAGGILINDIVPTAFPRVLSVIPNLGETLSGLGLK